MSSVLRQNDDTNAATSDSNELVVHCFQEAWGWRCGVLGWLGNTFLCMLQWMFARVWPCIGILVLPLSFCNVLANMMLSWLPWCITWDTKGPLQRSSGMCQVGVGRSSSCWRLLDSGLLMLSSREPEDTGFEAYSSVSGCHACSCFGVLASTEQLANKGILWAYWQEELAYGVVVITTHCAAPWCEAEILAAQMHQLIVLVNQLKAEYQPRTAAFELYLAGDFNQRWESTHDCAPNLAALCAQTGLARVCKQGGTHVRGFCIDHIFRYANECPREKKTSEIFDVPRTGCLPLSDHLLISLDMGALQTASKAVAPSLREAYEEIPDGCLPEFPGCLSDGVASQGPARKRSTTRPGSLEEELKSKM